MKFLSAFMLLTTFSAFAQVSVRVHENESLIEKTQASVQLGTGSNRNVQASVQAVYYLNTLNQGLFAGAEVGNEGLSVVGGNSFKRKNGDVISPYVQAGLANDNLHVGVRYSKEINNSFRGFADAGVKVAGGGRSYVRAGVAIPLSRSNRQ
jgi:hypothetical protein